MEEKKQYSALTIDRAAFLLLRVKKAFKKKKLQRKERERSAQLGNGSRIDQRVSCVGLENTGRTKKPPPLLRSRTLPAIIIPGVNILQVHQMGHHNQDVAYMSSSDTGTATTKFQTPRMSFSRDDSAAFEMREMRRKSAVSRLCGAGNYGSERATDGTLLLRVPSPHVVAARAYRMSNQSNNTFHRIGKLLSQGGSKNQMAVDDSNIRRRLSWERRDTICNKLPRSGSIDSMVDTVWAETVDTMVPLLPEKRPSIRLERPLALVSPSLGRRMKMQRGLNGSDDIYCDDMIGYENNKVCQSSDTGAVTCVIMENMYIIITLVNISIFEKN